jgi:hypothetical protein
MRWRKVVFAADCDADGNCPTCGIDYADCGCPGPTMDDHEYREIDGELYARGIHDEQHHTRPARQARAAPQAARQGNASRSKGASQARSTADGEGH